MKKLKYVILTLVLVFAVGKVSAQDQSTSGKIVEKTTIEAELGQNAHANSSVGVTQDVYVELGVFSEDGRLNVLAAGDPSDSDVNNSSEAMVFSPVQLQEPKEVPLFSSEDEDGIAVIKK